MQQKILIARKILSQTQVPHLPEEIILLQEELNKKYPNTVTVANLISHNPELLADFLERVNSDRSDERQPIHDAKAAVNVIGLDEIYNLYLSASLSQLIAVNEAEKTILLHGAEAGIAAAELSYWVQDVTRAEAYMAGLMQNIGAIYMSRYNPQQYIRIFERQNAHPISQFKREEEVFGTNHTIVGALVIKKWSIADTIYKSMIYHHDLEFAKQTEVQSKIKHLIALTMFSNYVVNTVTGKHYITEEMKNYRNVANAQLHLPEAAFQAANAAVLKWGKSFGLVNGTH